MAITEASIMIIMTAAMLKEDPSRRRTLNNSTKEFLRELFFHCAIYGIITRQMRNLTMRMRKKKWADPWLQKHAEYIYADPSENKENGNSCLHCKNCMSRLAWARETI
jgi:hypothetical protein